MPIKRRKADRHKTITHSSWQTFAHCRKKYYWQYERKLSNRKPSQPLLIGSMVHNELDHFYRSLGKYGETGVEESVRRIREEIAKLRREGQHGWMPNEWDMDMLCKAEALTAGIVSGYVAHYEERDAEKYSILEPESVFVLPVEGTSWQTTGKIDLLLRMKNSSQHAIMEHKTASSIDTGYVSKIALDKQTLRYIWAARKKYNLNVTTVIYNVILKTKIRQRKNESLGAFIRRVHQEYVLDPAKYFYRETIQPTKSQIESIPADDQLNVLEIERCREQGRYYMNTGHCYAYNSTCPFMPLCTGQGTVEDFRVRKAVHEELVED